MFNILNLLNGGTRVLGVLESYKCPACNTRSNKPAFESYLSIGPIKFRKQGIVYCPDCETKFYVSGGTKRKISKSKGYLVRPGELKLDKNAKYLINIHLNF